MKKYFLGIFPLLLAAGQMRGQDLPSQVRGHESRIEKLERLIGEQQRQIESLRRQNESRSTGQPGPAGPRGPAGPMGPQGETGPKGELTLPAGVQFVGAGIKIMNLPDTSVPNPPVTAAVEIQRGTSGGRARFTTSTGKSASFIGATINETGYASFYDKGKLRIRIGMNSAGDAVAEFKTTAGEKAAAEIG